MPFMPNKTLTRPFPWQIQQWNLILNRAKQQQLPHALLLTGAKGLGKELFAKNLIKTLLCEKGIELNQSCDQCRSCHLIAADTHPDFYGLYPEEAGKNIKIDKVRELIINLQQTSQYNQYKIALISPADALNMAASNALLKTLEEPAAKTLIILITEQLSDLSATIRSRCQIINFAAPTMEVATHWLHEHTENKTDISSLLQLTHCAPLSALKLIEDDGLAQQQNIIQGLFDLIMHTRTPLQLSKEWLKLPVDYIIDEIKYLMMDIIRYQLGLTSKLRNGKNIAEFNKVIVNADTKKLYIFLDHLYSLQRKFAATNLNQQLFLENLLYSISKAFE